MDAFIVINCVANVLLTFTSSIGNTLVLAAILRTPSPRSPSTIFLCSLAVSDLLVGIFVQPFYIAYLLQGGSLLSNIGGTLFILVGGVSVFTMTAISVDRFLALHYHMRYASMMTEKRATCILGTMWFISILLSALNLWHKSLALIAVGLAICILICTFSYIRIYRIVRQHQLQIHAQQQAAQSFNTEQGTNMARWQKSAINTFIYYICMIICYIPMFTAISVVAVNSSSLTREWTLVNTLVFLNSSINPILYCWRVRELRRAVVRTVRNLLCKKTEET